MHVKAHKLAACALAALLSACATAPVAPMPNEALSTLAAGFGAEGQGCAYAIRERGVLTHEGAAGVASLETGAPLSPRDLFDVGSVSKSFTAAVILDLEARGALALTDHVSDYVNGLPAWGQRVTVADLLYMRSGIPDFRVDIPGDGGWPDDRLRGSDLSPMAPVSLELILDTIRTLDTLEFEPGARYTYSNTNYMLLRAVTERAGRAPLGEQVERVARRIAGINARVPAHRDGLRQSPSSVLGYDVAANNGSQHLLSNWDVFGASSVWVSVEDLARWGEGLMADRARFEHQAEIGILRYPDQDQDRGYAAGLMTLRRNGERIVYHLGGTEGFSSGVFMRPEHDQVMAFSCNMSPELFFARGMRGAARATLMQGRELVFLETWLNSEPAAR